MLMQTGPTQNKPIEKSQLTAGDLNNGVFVVEVNLNGTQKLLIPTRMQLKMLPEGFNNIQQA